MMGTILFICLFSSVAAEYVTRQLPNGERISCTKVDDLDPCPPGTEVKPCVRAYEREVCSPCPAGLHQCDSSTSDLPSPCYDPRSKCSQDGDVKVIGEGCDVVCICNEDNGYTGADHSFCQHTGPPCPTNSSRHSSLGCLPCSDGFHNPRDDGLDKCVEMGSEPTSTKETEKSADNVKEAPKVIPKNSAEASVDYHDDSGLSKLNQLQPNKNDLPDNTDWQTIAKAVLIAVGCVALIAIVVKCGIYCRKHKKGLGETCNLQVVICGNNNTQQNNHPPVSSRSEEEAVLEGLINGMDRGPENPSGTPDDPGDPSQGNPDEPADQPVERPDNPDEPPPKRPEKPEDEPGRRQDEPEELSGKGRQPEEHSDLPDSESDRESVVNYAPPEGHNTAPKQPWSSKGNHKSSDVGRTPEPKYPQSKDLAGEALKRDLNGSGPTEGMKDLPSFVTGKLYASGTSSETDIDRRLQYHKDYETHLSSLSSCSPEQSELYSGPDHTHVKTVVENSATCDLKFDTSMSPEAMPLAAVSQLADSDDSLYPSHRTHQHS